MTGPWKIMTRILWQFLLRKNPFWEPLAQTKTAASLRIYKSEKQAGRYLYVQTLTSFTKQFPQAPKAHTKGAEQNLWKCLDITFSYSHIHKASSFKFCPLFDCFRGCYNIVSKDLNLSVLKELQQCGHSLIKCKELVLTPFLAAQLLFYNCSLIVILYVNMKVCGSS